MGLYSLLNRTQRLVSRSDVLTRAAVLVRNQCNLVIGYHVTPSSDAAVNGELWLVDTLGSSCRRFVDVGANVGHWAQALLERSTSETRGLLFEPSLSAGARLREALGGESRVEIVDAAAGDTVGEMEFAEETNAGETSSLVTGWSAPGASRRTVRTTTLDKELNDRGWKDIDLLKVDVEGYDFHVLLGARQLFARQGVKVVQFEYNTAWALAGSTLSKARAWLGSHGYQLYTARSGGLEPAEARNGEYFTYSNYVALSAAGEELLRAYVRRR